MYNNFKAIPSNFQAIIYICLSATLFVPFATASVKYLSYSFTITEIVWVRALGQTIWMLLLFVPRHGWSIIIPKKLDLQLIRSTLLFFATFCFVTGIKNVPLATAHVIGFASPLFVVALSAFWLKEIVYLRRWVAVAVGFMGVLIVMRPGLGAGLPPTAGWLMLASLCWSLVQILSRKIAPYERAETTAIYTYIVALIATSVTLPIVTTVVALPTPIDWLAIVCVGLFGGIRHYFIIKAYELAPASLIAPFNYTELLGAAIMGFLIFGTLPDHLTWFGAAIIIGAGIYLAQSEQRV